MRRKYDLRNKRSFIIVMILVILVIGIFSLFIYKYQNASKIEYEVSSGSIIQDINKNYFSLDDDAKLKIRWNNEYYLVYNDENINLGKNVIIYNEITGGMKLYGNFYEIKEDGKIVECRDETVLANTTNTKFYKIADREYLLVDTFIRSNDKSIDTSNYLLVELDKLGNAKLSNNKINLKTITPTTLITTKYQFDINNEILNYGKYDIDLKKIIGTSNQYVPEEPEEDNQTDNDIGTNLGTNTTPSPGGFGGIDGNGGGSGNISDDIINNTDKEDEEDNTLEEIKDKTKKTSVIRVYEGLTSIDFDYVVYDPYNEYTSIYAEIVKPNKVETIYLSKNDTHLVIDKLAPDTDYIVSFIYTTVDTETGEIERNTFDKFDLKTRKPVYSISVYGISSYEKKLTYKVNLQEGYSINKVNVSLSFTYKELDEETNQLVEKQTPPIISSISVTDNNKYVLGSIDISKYNISYDTLIKLNIDSVESNNGTIIINSSYTFKLGGKYD